MRNYYIKPIKSQTKALILSHQLQICSNLALLNLHLILAQHPPHWRRFISSLESQAQERPNSLHHWFDTWTKSKSQIIKIGCVSQLLLKVELNSLPKVYWPLFKRQSNNLAKPVIKMHKISLFLSPDIIISRKSYTTLEHRTNLLLITRYKLWLLKFRLRTSICQRIKWYISTYFKTAQLVCAMLLC